MNWGKILFSFDGRIGRKGFWIVMVILLVVGMILNVVALAPVMAAMQQAAVSGQEPAAMPSFPMWIWIVFIPMIWISLAVQAKRWHDQDKSAWWILINLIPGIGGLIALIMCGFIAGTPAQNRFGDVPSM
jgi:uncharacterized membrane protein YhaH (DUF805 family)